MKNYKITIFYQDGYINSFYKKEKPRYAGKLYKKLMEKEKIKNVEIECLDEDDD